jgi:fatty-acid desaturase
VCDVQAVFGWGAVVWTNAFPVMIGWHFIFLVNSACHLWGRQPYDAGAQLSRVWFLFLKHV